MRTPGPEIDFRDPIPPSTASSSMASIPPVEECVAFLGWGSFHRVPASVREARYHDWTGSKRTGVALEEIGDDVDDQGEYPGIRFAFVGTPTGPRLFELLQTTGDTPPPGAESGSAGAGEPKAAGSSSCIAARR